MLVEQFITEGLLLLARLDFRLVLEQQVLLLQLVLAAALVEELLFLVWLKVQRVKFKLTYARQV